MDNQHPNPLVVRVFLSSPGDVNDERLLVYQEIENFIYQNSYHRKVILEPYGWDRKNHYIPMEAHTDPQNAIDQRMPKASECDIVIVILWSRMGQLMNTDIEDKIKPEAFQYEVGPEENKKWYFSGTEWEFVNAMQAAQAFQHPRVFVFRKIAQPPFLMDDPNINDKMIQAQRVTRFFTQFEANNQSYLKKSYDKYTTLDQFREKILAVFSTVVDEFLLKTPAQILARKEQEVIQKIAWKGSPFPGLRAFHEQDAPIFFGRNKETYELLEQLSKQRFVAVIGASGAGKSSIVRAGLVPLLKQDGILLSDDPSAVAEDDSSTQWKVESGNWIYLTMTPGQSEEESVNNPFSAFFQAVHATVPTVNLQLKDKDYFKSMIEDQCLKVVNTDSAININTNGDNPLLKLETEKLRKNIEEWLNGLWVDKPESSELLLIIDQFEELFTIVEDPDIRAGFIAFIHNCAQHTRVRIMITMRADFFHYCLEYPSLASLLRMGAFTLAPPGLGALYEMIRRPAELANLKFEDDLAEKILVETAENPGGLPLMAYLLDQMYEQCQDKGILSLEVFEKLGKVAGAIGTRASSIIADLARNNPGVREALHYVFRELVEVNDQGVLTRRRAVKSSLLKSETTSLVLDSLTDARLLVTNLQVNETNNETIEIVEVAHEALLREWKELNHWIKEKQEAFVVRRKVEDAAIEWENNQKAPNLLWNHERLIPVYEAYQKLEYNIAELPVIIQEFIQPEANRIIGELSSEDTSHSRRNEIGLRLWALGDNRPGVGVDENGIPEIVWCKQKVNEGKVKLEDIDKLFDAKSFYIAKLPITLTQFQAFVNADDGYNNLEWWEGLDKKPWEHKPYNQIPEIGNHPAVWMSWHQSIAFCRWLSKKLGYTVRIPYEWEWQQAATNGNIDYAYPWGKDWDSAKCNSLESGLNTIVSVGLYPAGCSPVGALDMSGNIYEWCMNSYDLTIDAEGFNGNAKKTTRGGAFFIPRPLQDKLTAREVVKVTTRLDDDPIAPAQGRLRVTLRIVADTLPASVLEEI